MQGGEVEPQKITTQDRSQFVLPIFFQDLYDNDGMKPAAAKLDMTYAAVGDVGDCSKQAKDPTLVLNPVQPTYTK